MILNCCIDGSSVEMLEIGSDVLCSKLIDSYDLMRVNECLQRKLLDDVGVATMKEPQITAFEDFARMDESWHFECPPVSLQCKIDLSALKPILLQARGEAEQLQTRLTRGDPNMLQSYDEMLDSWVANQ